MQAGLATVAVAGGVREPRAVEAGVGAAIRAHVALAEVQVLHQDCSREQGIGEGREQVPTETVQCL